MRDDYAERMMALARRLLRLAHEAEVSGEIARADRLGEFAASAVEASLRAQHTLS